jgi:predicted DCC family thiol-disulfide oxidoreductase YuxK
MTDETRILYNDTCPLCRFEIDHYRAAAARDDAPMRFDTLQDAARWGLTEDQAARRLHVLHKGEVLSGLAAFRAIWAGLPRWRWLARLTGLPLIHPALAFVYDRIAAPLLYRAHLRRQSRRKQPRQM